MGEELRAQLAAVLERKTMHLHQRHSGFVSNRVRALGETPRAFL